MIEQSEDERRGREKFVRERDYGFDRFQQPRRDFGGGDRMRRDYNGGVGGIKRTGGRREDESSLKKNRVDMALDSFEPQFIKKDEDTTPYMLTFKKFLATLDDSVSDDDAISKYLEYKIEFKKQECDRYFHTHKEEEWFRQKYHPEDAKRFKESAQGFVFKRLAVFNELFDKGSFSGVSLDYTCSVELIRFMDTVVVKLEDGTDEDVELLKNEEIDDESVVELTKSNELLKDNNNGVENQQQQGGSSNGVVNDAKPKTFLHKTCSIFFRNIPKDVKSETIENICKQHLGYLRIGFTDVLPGAQTRMGYVTYRQNAKIKEIFWKLRNIKLNGVDIQAGVNRDLKRRIRFVNGLAAHKAIVQNDIRQAAKLIVLYDYKASLFLPEEENDGSIIESPYSDLEGAIIKSKNPLFKDIIDFLVDEGDAEEELLLGYGDKPEEASKVPIELDKKYLTALDILIIYLRIVHSIDFYNSCEYINEDTMPHRMSILHVRGKYPTDEHAKKTDGGVPLISKSAVDEYITSFNERLGSNLFKNIPPEESELEKLGKKNPEKAVENFITTNCVEQAKDKWLCPLSGKKFKAPEFIHKHLHSKYQDKIDEVQNEAMFYNNFLVDPNRPKDYVEPPKIQQQPIQTAGPQRSSVEDGALNNLQQGVAENFDRSRSNIGYRQWGSDRNFGFGGGPRFGGGNRVPYQHGRDLNRPPRFHEPINELSRRGPAPSYRDLDAPDEIV